MHVGTESERNVPDVWDRMGGSVAEVKMATLKYLALIFKHQSFVCNSDLQKLPCK